MYIRTGNPKARIKPQGTAPMPSFQSNRRTWTAPRHIPQSWSQSYRPRRARQFLRCRSASGDKFRRHPCPRNAAIGSRRRLPPATIGAVLLGPISRAIGRSSWSPGKRGGPCGVDPRRAAWMFSVGHRRCKSVCFEIAIAVRSVSGLSDTSRGCVTTRRGLCHHECFWLYENHGCSGEGVGRRGNGGFLRLSAQ